jgi:hypothetical protein
MSHAAAASTHRVQFERSAADTEFFDRVQLCSMRRTRKSGRNGIANPHSSTLTPWNLLTMLQGAAGVRQRQGRSSTCKVRSVVRERSNTASVVSLESSVTGVVKQPLDVGDVIPELHAMPQGSGWCF